MGWPLPDSPQPQPQSPQLQAESPRQQPNSPRPQHGSPRSRRTDELLEPLQSLSIGESRREYASPKETDRERTSIGESGRERTSVGESGGERLGTGPLYLPLEHEHSFRLLEIQPGKGRQNIVCSLESVRLENDHPRYEAISYVWGDPDDKGSVVCNNKLVTVHRCLISALRRFRKSDRTRRVWIDGLCINQKDAAERGQQVQLMRHIFAHAKRVLIWLGKPEDSGDARALFSALRQYGRSETTGGEDSVKSVGDPGASLDLFKSQLNKFFGLRWFSRVWVVQEVVLARSACMCWGSSKVDFDVVGGASKRILKESTHLLGDRALAGAESATFIHLLKTRRKRKVKFISIMSSTVPLKASDPRDKVYGLLGIPTTSSSLNGDLFIQPDYSISAYEANARMARKYMAQEKNLSLLAHVDHGAELRADIPSWIPQWHEARRPASRIFEHSRKPCKQLPKHKPRVSDDDILRLKGVRIGIVGECLPTMLRQSSMRPADLRRDSHQDSSWSVGSQFDYDNERHASEEAKAMYGLASSLMQSKNLRSMLAIVMSTATKSTSLFGRPLYTTEYTKYLDFLTYVLMPPRDGHKDDNLLLRISSDTVISLASLFRAVLFEVGDLEARRRELERVDDDDEILTLAAKRVGPGTFTHDNGDRFLKAASAACHGRRLFLTKESQLGLGPAAMREGDVICLPCKGRFPLVLRPEEPHWRLVGECRVPSLEFAIPVPPRKTAIDLIEDFRIK